MSRFFKLLTGLLLLVVAVEIPQLVTESTAITSYAAHLAFKHNFHPVIPGRFYRAAEMPDAALREYINHYKIASVINLERSADETGADEQALVERLGAKYFAVPMNSGRVMTRDKVERLFAALDSAPEPILVHCSSGTHRSGVVSAIWLMDKVGRPVEEARRQLSMRYGFFAWERKLKSWWSGNPTIDTMITNFAGDPNHAPENFRAWAFKNALPN